LLADSSSLKNFLLEVLPEAYANARLLAAEETGLTLEELPDTHCHTPWSKF
jgi:hypothetical protein